MRGRVMRHFGTCFVGFAAGIAGCMAVGAAAPATLARFAVPLFILIIPIVGFYSTFKNLRCPSCEKMVAFQVSQNYSAFGRWARHECRHCNAHIFYDQKSRGGKGMKIVFLTIFGVIIALGILGAASAMLAKGH